MRSSSGMNSLHRRMTSGVQRSAASEACATAGFVPPATINTVSSPAAAHSSDLEYTFKSFVTLISLMIEIAFAQYLAAIGSSSAGNNEMSVQPLSVTTTSSSMRAAE